MLAIFEFTGFHPAQQIERFCGRAIAEA